MQLNLNCSQGFVELFDQDTAERRSRDVHFLNSRLFSYTLRTYSTSDEEFGHVETTADEHGKYLTVRQISEIKRERIHYPRAGKVYTGDLGGSSPGSVVVKGTGLDV